MKHLHNIAGSQNKRVDDHVERRITELYVSEMRLLEEAQKHEPSHHISPKYRWVEDLIHDDRALTILAQRVNKMLKEEVLRIEKDLRSRDPDEWIPKHTTAFTAHRFYLAVKRKFNADIERFLAENPDIT